MGFLKPAQLGPAWVKQYTPPREAMRAILDLDFVNVVPAHGEVVVGDGPQRFRPTIEQYCSG